MPFPVIEHSSYAMFAIIMAGQLVRPTNNSVLLQL